VLVDEDKLLDMTKAAMVVSTLVWILFNPLYVRPSDASPSIRVSFSWGDLHIDTINNLLLFCRDKYRFSVFCLFEIQLSFMAFVFTSILMWG